MAKHAKKEKPRGPFPPCTVTGCKEPGEFKAPRMRGSEGDYQHLCLEHVRKFNEAWNYFDGWSQKEIEAFMHSSVHGHRPTWSHQLGGHSTESLEEALRRMLGEGPAPKVRKPETKAERKRREALAVLNLEPGCDMASVKSHYKKLVKKYHPDVNSTRDAEDMFKRITDAYDYLVKKAEL